jgi:DNA-binding helix-hairpin-helix protein with protein kinase domain
VASSGSVSEERAALLSGGSLSAASTAAEGEKRAAKTLDRVVRKRLDYVTSLFREAGFSPAEARARGDLLAVYIMSEDSILANETLETRLRLMRRQIRLLTC